MDTSVNPHEVEHFRDRVRLYLQVMLIIDIGAHVSDIVSPFFIADLTMPSYPPAIAILRYGVSVALAIGWSFTKFVKLNRPALIAFEGGATIGLALVYVLLATAHMSGEGEAFGPSFAMFGLMLLLTVRAALVPSPVSRTVVIGLAAVACLFAVGNEAIRTLDPTVIDGLTFAGGAIVLVNAVTSRVIYGLRREVREARQLGQYTLEELLGEGGMGAVYRARHAMLRREAAIKLIKPELTGEGARRTQALQRFEREAHVTANLKSPHTIQLYDFGVSEEGAFYYVMELLDGIDLETAIKQYGPMPPERVVFLLRQACDSLEEAHAAGLVHRDIKPANVFLCRHGMRFDFVKVLDFGLVALGSRPGSDPRLTTDGFAAGTPAYVAPEIAAGADTVDGRADVYAIGCVAYWLLSGHAPFERESAMATILAHVNETPLPPSSVSEIAIPQPLEALVLECLDKRPAGRPASAADLARRLDAVAVADTWDQKRAARWWETHKPSRSSAPASVSRDDTLKVTKAFR